MPVWLRSNYDFLKARNAGVSQECYYDTFKPENAVVYLCRTGIHFFPVNNVVI